MKKKIHDALMEPMSLKAKLVVRTVSLLFWVVYSLLYAFAVITPNVGLLIAICVLFELTIMIALVKERREEDEGDVREVEKASKEERAPLSIVKAKLDNS